MKKMALTGALALVIGLTLYPIVGNAQIGPGYGPRMYADYGCGYGIGPWRMGPGYGYQNGPRHLQPQKALDQKDARAILENYLESTRNPNLKLGQIKDKGDAFEGEILTQKGSLVDEILVDKETGWMRSVY